MTSSKKSFYLRSIAEKLRHYKSYGSQILSKENGKTLLQCEGEFEGAPLFLNIMQELQIK